MRGRILIVEDNELNHDMLSRFLELFGYRTSLALDGAQALEACRREAPDLVLMDLTLPDLDGCEVTRRLKANPATRRIPVIALTAHAMLGDRERCLAAGCDEYETKPIRIAELRQKIDALLGVEVVA